MMLVLVLSFEMNFTIKNVFGQKGAILTAHKHWISNGFTVPRGHLPKSQKNPTSQFPPGYAKIGKIRALSYTIPKGYVAQECSNAC